MKKTITIILLMIIALIAIGLYILTKDRALLEDVCVYKYSSSAKDSAGYIDKQTMAVCVVKELTAKIIHPVAYCQSIAAPICAVTDNDIVLCEGMMKQDKWQGTLEACQLNWACPELAGDYEKVIKECGYNK